MFNDDRYRFCPAYFNGGVIRRKPPLSSPRIAPSLTPDHLTRLLAGMGSDFEMQLAIATPSIGVRSEPLCEAAPFRFNMPTHPLLEALHYDEIEHAVILHLLGEHQLRRVETFASLASLEGFLAYGRCGSVSRMAQEVIQAIFPDLAAEESRTIAA